MKLVDPQHFHDDGYKLRCYSNNYKIKVCVWDWGEGRGGGRLKVEEGKSCMCSLIF